MQYYLPNICRQLYIMGLRHVAGKSRRDTISKLCTSFQFMLFRPDLFLQACAAVAHVFATAQCMDA